MTAVWVFFPGLVVCGGRTRGGVFDARRDKGRYVCKAAGFRFAFCGTGGRGVCSFRACRKIIDRGGGLGFPLLASP